jgi:DNA polymerase III subunit beta
MKFTLSRDKLLEVLQQVQSVVSTRTTLPILSNILIKAQKSGLSMTATDLDVGVQSSIEAEIEQVGGTTLPARRFFNIVRELPANDVRIETDSKNIASIRSGQYVSKIVGLPEDEFPPLPKFDESRAFTLKQAELKDGLKRTAYAISTDETRYVLNGVLFAFKDNKLTLVATDGRRLALMDIEAEITAEQEVSLIVPAKAVNELQRLLKDDGDVKIKVGQNQIAFELNGALLVSKLIEGNYPNYRQVIPAETKERVTLERESFHNAVRRVAILTSEKSNSIKLVLTKNNLDIVANSPEIGEAKETIAVKYTGKEFTIAFNPDLLMAPLRNLVDDEIYLDLIDEMSPGLIRTKGPFLYVLMPMRINY